MVTYKIIDKILYALILLLSDDIDSIEREQLKNELEKIIDDYEDLGFLIDKLQ